MADNDTMLHAVARIVAAIVATHGTETAALPELVLQVRRALEGAVKQPLTRVEREVVQPEELIRHVIERGNGHAAATGMTGVFPDHLLCLECGEKAVLLKLHLKHHHQTTFEQYRTKFRLPDDYPSVPTEHSAHMRQRMEEAGLGHGLKSRWPQVREAARKAMEQTTKTKSTSPVEPAKPAREPYDPAVDPRASVFPDHLVCLSCGEHFKTISRHLKSAHGLSFEQYRDKWNLPASYPAICPNTSTSFHARAVRAGLGRHARSRTKEGAIEAKRS